MVCGRVRIFASISANVLPKMRTGGSNIRQKDGRAKVGGYSSADTDQEDAACKNEQSDARRRECVDFRAE